MNKKKETVVLLTISIVIVGILSLLLNNSGRYFTEYMYDEIGALAKGQQVHAMESTPKDSGDEDEPEEPKEPEESIKPEKTNPMMDHSEEDRSDSKYENNDSDKSSESEDNDGDNEEKEKVTSEPVTTATPDIYEPNHTELPQHINIPTAVPTSEPTHTPKPTPEPSATPTSKPTATPTSAPRLVSISASWPDKDSLLYKSNITTTTLTVTGEMSDGSITSIPLKDCSIIGLDSMSLGEHTMIIRYEDVRTTLTYTIIRGQEYILDFEWDVSKNQGKYIIGEDIRELLYVFKEYDDGEQEAIEEYGISGIDFSRVGRQTGTITYEDKTKFITVDVVEKQYSKTVKYYSQSGELIKEDSNVTAIGLKESFKVTEPDSNVIYEGQEYTLSSVEFKVDRGVKSFPYTIRERDISAEVICVYIKNN